MKCFNFNGVCFSYVLIREEGSWFVKPDNEFFLETVVVFGRFVGWLDEIIP